MNRLARRLQNRYTAFVHDLIMIPLAWLGAYSLRFNLDGIPDEFWSQAVRLLPVVLFAQGSLFWLFGLYRGVWRYASIPDLMRILKATLTGVAVSAAVIFFLTRLQGVPRSVFVLDAVLLVLLLGGPRFLYRWIKDRRLYGHEVQNVLIVGAGQAGEMLVRDLMRDPNSGYRPVAFVDDDPAKLGKELHGIRVQGSCDNIASLCQRFDIHVNLIAMPSAKSRQMRRVVSLCEEAGIPFRSLPQMKDLVSGQVSVRELRDVKIEDLLGRESVSLDWQAISRSIRDEVVLVTGGGGSIGTELCRQVARLKPSRLIIFERSEYHLYSIEHELGRDFPGLRLEVVLGDIGDRVLTDRVFSRGKPAVVFHAAAYKHVPMLEGQARTAVVNNILGTRVVAEAAARHRARKFVMISTDKAVNPANVMGMTKRIAEMVCQAADTSSGTHFITVRFGNVLGSAGSVIPLFQKQIEAGGPVTVTHPEITRYFMTIPEATQLILQAGCMGKGGEIFVLDMGEPVKISYLAEQLIRLSGKRPGEDIEIVYRGLRPGEKLYEELFHESEKLAGTGHPKILLANSRAMNPTELNAAMDELASACIDDNEILLISLLRNLVPEHQMANRRPDEADDKSEANVVPIRKTGPNGRES